MGNKDTILNTKVTLLGIIVTIVGIVVGVVSLFATTFGFDFSGIHISIGGSKANSVIVGGNSASAVSVISNNSIQTTSIASSNSRTVISNIGRNSIPVITSVEESSHKIENLPKNNTNSLIIDGVGNTIEIRRGDQHTQFKGASVSGVSLEQVVYIERGRNINVFIQGTGHSLFVDRYIMPDLSITNSGVGVDISEF